MSDARLRTVTLCVAVATLVLIAAGAVAGSRSAASTLAERAHLALADAGLDGVSVTFAGREATLSGGSRADLTESQAIVSHLSGVRSARIVADGQESPPGAEPVANAHMRLWWAGQTLRLRGVVPSAHDAAAIKSAASLAFGQAVTGDVRVDSRATAPAWMSQLPAVIHELAAVRQAVISIEDDGQFQMAGLIESAAGRTLLERRVKAALTGARVGNRLTVDSRGLAKGHASVINTTSVQFEPGSAIVTYVAAEQINRIAEVLNQKPTLRLVVTGNENSGPQVRAVRDYLTAVGMSADRLAIRASGIGVDGRVDFRVADGWAGQPDADAVKE